MSSAGASKAAVTRRWNKNFDPKPYIEYVGAKLSTAGLAVLPDGRYVSFFAGRPGKVVVVLSTKGTKSLQRTFGAKQLGLVKLWVDGGGSLEHEETKKAITAAAKDLLIQLRSVLAVHSHERGCCKNALALIDRLPLPPPE